MSATSCPFTAQIQYKNLQPLSNVDTNLLLHSGRLVKLLDVVERNGR